MIKVYFRKFIQLGEQMRIVICCMGLLATSVLVGCGQTGALQLPSDPNYDKRAQYMLYKNDTQSSKQPKQVQENAAQDQISQTVPNPAPLSQEQVNPTLADQEKPKPVQQSKE